MTEQTDSVQSRPSHPASPAPWDVWRVRRNTARSRNRAWATNTTRLREGSIERLKERDTCGQQVVIFRMGESKPFDNQAERGRFGRTESFVFEIEVMDDAPNGQERPVF